MKPLPRKAVGRLQAVKAARWIGAHAAWAALLALGLFGWVAEWIAFAIAGLLGALAV